MHTVYPEKSKIKINLSFHTIPAFYFYILKYVKQISLHSRIIKIELGQLFNAPIKFNVRICICSYFKIFFTIKNNKFGISIIHL